MQKRILIALILMGFTSLVVQALLIREFLITFYGNELTIGLILACWIISEAAGSWAASRFVNKIKLPFLFYAVLQILISIYLPISIFLIRNVKNILPVTPGEGLGITAILGSCLLIIGPLSIFDGMQFPFGCRMHDIYKKGPQQTAGRVYILEAIGFILAGPVFTYIFLTRLHSFQIAFLIGLINLVSAFLLSSLRGASDSERQSNLLLGAFVSLLIIVNSYILFSNLSSGLHKFSIATQWKNQTLVEYKNSIYGNLAVVQKREQYTFFSDGIPIINIPAPDLIWTEEFVHFGMLSHPNPKEILFLCGGAGGLIDEALKHPIERIDYAELDPLLIKLLKEFPRALTERELTDPRVNLKITDGIRFIKRTDARYDIIFVNLPSPSTLQLNRYYTKEFFGRIKKILKPDGQLVLSLPGSLSYLNKELIQLNLCVLSTLKGVFPEVFVIPGDNNLYISSSMPIKISKEAFLEGIAQRGIATNLLTPFHLEYRLKKYWQAWFYETLGKKQTRVKENRNLTPSGVFYGILYWNSLFSPYLRKFFNGLDSVNFNQLIYFVVALILIIFLLRLTVIARSAAKGGTTKQSPVGVAVSIATTGFVGMSFDLIFIMTYQVFFGYVYHHIALLITSFMAGLTLGGWLITKNLERIKKGLFWFLIMEILIILFCLSAGLFLNYLNNINEFRFYPIFFILSGICGFLVGAEFPLANRLYFKEAHYIKTAGILYALDLSGAFFAALLVSIIFLPVFGVLKACLFSSILKAAGLLLYLPQNKR